ncbi:competence type IV pilus minor pilin ComGD [Bacillus sp. PS06]|uniref:competence type IV pilus minor pilin ComGD n=1 Tax=Bacillus sp. PS06 TaxID=2764176 RepID=UPI001781DE8E|nr:competence type IV pilus minor pilin ComGD [Bacillus sp. PS06]MBD8071335.1 prepilin-type N-terminal cleavage/methylation domain-containing protein [Bacillus sp. PS06]
MTMAQLKLTVVKVKNQKGFTLIETLLVLSILIILTTLPFLKLSPLQEEKIIEHFFEQLTDDLLLSQQYAIMHSDSVKVYFFHASSSYKVILVETNTVVISRNYDENITINPLTLGTTIQFRNNGNISKAGTMQVVYKKSEKYNVVFQLGRGRFYVTKV